VICLKADLVVIGAGPCGFSAALSAKRNGLDVILVEKRAFPGGVISGAGVNSMLTFFSLKGEKIVGGIPQEMIDDLVSAGASLGHIRDTVGVAWSVTPISPSAVSLYFTHKCSKEGIRLLTNCEFKNANVKNNRIISVICKKENEALKLSAPLFLDSSGEGVLGEFSGAELLPAENSGKMPMTLIFNVGNVNKSEIIKYIDGNRYEFHHETLWDELKVSKAIGVSGFFSLWKEANLSVPRDRILFYETLNKGEVSVNSTRIFSNSDSSFYEKGLHQVYEIAQFLRNKVPGFKESFISCIYPFIGIREGNRIKGHYSLKADDVILGRRFSDEITFGGFPIDIHSSKTDGLQSISLKGAGFYGIPYRTLVSFNIENLFIGGKCFSAEFEAHASARVQATAMALGQAAGTAASLCVLDKKSYSITKIK